jgi:hypothetical protein
MRWLVALVLVLAACKSAKKDKPDETRSGRAEPMTPVERKRGEDACTTYVKELCECAAKRPDDARLAEQCELKKAKPEALGLLLAVDDDLKASDDSRLRAQIEARKLISKCVMEHASLPTLGCR